MFSSNILLIYLTYQSKDVLLKEYYNIPLLTVKKSTKEHFLSVDVISSIPCNSNFRHEFCRIDQDFRHNNYSMSNFMGIHEERPNHEHGT